MLTALEPGRHVRNLEIESDQLGHCRRVGSDLFAIGAKFVDYKAPRRSKNR